MSPADGSARQPGDRVGPYELVAKLGAGGMGDVYRARHGESGEQVALKVIRTPSRALAWSLRQEIRALRGLAHPAIVGIVDDGEDEFGPWHAMELVTGRTLRARIGVLQGTSPTREAFGGADLSTNVDPRHARQHYVKQDEVRMVGPPGLKCFHPIGGKVDHEAFLLQGLPQTLTECGLIVDDKNADALRHDDASGADGRCIEKLDPSPGLDSTRTRPS